MKRKSFSMTAFCHTFWDDEKNSMVIFIKYLKNNFKKTMHDGVKKKKFLKKSFHETKKKVKLKKNLKNELKCCQ